MIYILSDDLTGASDTGVQFTNQGYKVYVTTPTLSDIKATRMLNYDVLSFNLDTRNLDDKTAFNKVCNMIKQLDISIEDLVIKKIDSLFRGNIFPEIDAIMTVFGFEGAFITSTYPSNRRFIVDGQLHGNDKIVDIFDLVPKKYKEKTKLISLNKDIEQLVFEINDYLSKDIRYFIFNSKTDSDLRIIWKLRTMLASPILMCGSAGIAKNYDTYKLLNYKASHLPHNYLIVSGSKNFVTENQISYLLKYRKTADLNFNVDDILHNKEKTLTKLRVYIDTLKSKSEDTVLLHIEQRNLEDKLDYTLSEEQKDIGQRIISFLGYATKNLFDSFNFDILIIIGGDTARELMKQLDVEGISLEEELLPGIPIGKVVGGHLNGRLIVTKSGAFGENQEIMMIIDKIEKKNNKYIMR